MSLNAYQELTLDWSLERKSDRQFKLIAAASILFMVVCAIILSSIELPEPPRQAKQLIPERIANFLLEKKKAQPKIQKPEPKPKPKLKKPETKPKDTVKKIKKTKKKTKPLTKTQKQARKKAAETGLLALSSELSDLMDTSDISAMVGGEVKAAAKGADSQKKSNTRELMLAEAGTGSGGVDAGSYSAKVGKTTLTKHQISAIQQSLVTEKSIAAKSASSKASAKGKSSTGGVRSEEAITLVFDQKKGKLFTLYNRARRKNPGLKGKIIFQLTIAPSGKVEELIVVSSELNDEKLEAKLLRRIKQFNFGARDVKKVTVTYPIEFLPS